MTQTTLPPSHHAVLQAVDAIQPLDDLERQHRRSVLSWIRSGAPLFRVAKPDTPPQHLVSYFVLVDPGAQALLLVDHRKAQKWLPTGGHVDPDEHPWHTVEREAQEELAITARALPALGPVPLFITSTVTGGLTPGHTDISLWYVLEASTTQALTHDPAEFHAIRWFTFPEVHGMDPGRLDPHFHRFLAKLEPLLSA